MSDSKDGARFSDTGALREQSRYLAHLIIRDCRNSFDEDHFRALALGATCIMMSTMISEMYPDHGDDALDMVMGLIAEDLRRKGVLRQ